MVTHARASGTLGKQTYPRGRRIRYRAYIIGTCRYAFLGALTAVVVYPLIWVALSGLRSNQDLLLHPFSLPSSITTKNYSSILVGDEFYRNIWNSLWISGVTTLLVMVLSIGLAYALARLEWRLRPITMMYIALGLLIPVHAALIPMYVYLHPVIDFAGPRTAIIVPYVALRLPVSILMLTAYFRRIPDEIEESAVLDGCSMARLIPRIIVPISTPALVMVATFTFVSAWNELLFGLVFLTYPQDQTVAVSLLRFVGAFGTDWASVFAGITLAVIPTLVIYLLLQRKLIEGVMMGAVVE